MLRNLRKRIEALTGGRPLPCGADARRRKNRCGNRLTFEPLEPRLALNGGPLVISELMADNATSLTDQDGDPSDWIEIHNVSNGQVNLGGYHLTDDSLNLQKWHFPAVTLDAGQFLVVFASGKDRATAGSELHTNFQLASEGEYLALVEPDGVTVAHAYAPAYPAQYEDVSYGLRDVNSVLVDSGAQAKFHVPIAGEDATAWTAPAFDDSSWAGSYSVDEAGVLITEIGTGAVRLVEIENLAREAIDTSGWTVLVNNAATGNINAVQSAAWSLPDSLAPGEVLYKTDDVADHYWGSAINWQPDGPGWVMILDDVGQVRDFAAWGYSAAQIAGLNVSYGGFANVTVGSQWSGAGAQVGTADPGGPIAGGFVAYNDHIAGPQTHANATAYDAVAGGTPSGPLKDIATGLATAATLTTTQAGVTFDVNSTPPSPGTDAYNLFNGYVDFSTGANTSIEIAAADTYTHTFTGLDTTDTFTYNVAATSIRGNSGYTNRWTLVTLVGADSAVAAPSVGSGVVQVSPTEIAYMAGYNSAADQGFVAAWSEIDPGADGEFSIVSTHYTGAIPGGTANGNKSYAVTAVRLEAVAPEGPPSWLKRVGHRDGNAAADFVRDTTSSPGSENADLVAPFGDRYVVATGIGYSSGQPAFDSLIETDVSGAMRNVNASLLTRIEFDNQEVFPFDSLTLRMKYDDGFIAYLNGVEVARRNAANPLAYDTTASAQHADAAAVVFEDIDISDKLGLLRPGANVLAIRGLNLAAGDGDFLLLPELVAAANLSAMQYMTEPTPWSANSSGVEGFVADTKFSVNRGFYDVPQQVSITTATAGATIRYTLDGSDPTETNGMLYTGPLTIDATTVLRAAAFKPYYAPTSVDTQTYLIGASDAVRSLPVISLAANEDGTFGVDRGLFADVLLRGMAAEFPVSFEAIDAASHSAIQQDGGIRLEGSSYQRRILGADPDAKWSFDTYFRDSYDDQNWLNYPLIERTSVERFRSLTLRSGYADSVDPFVKDELGRRLHQDMGSVAGVGTFVNVLINGELNGNGYYNLVERLDQDMFQEKLGSVLPWDVVTKWQGTGLAADPPRSHAEPYYFEVRDGSATDFADLLDYALAHDLSQDLYYQQIAQRLDVPQLIDYLILEGYACVEGWPQDNWVAAREQSSGDLGKWRFYASDLEYGWDAANLTSGFKTPGGGSQLPIDILYTRLSANAQFRRLFGDRAGAAFFNGGALSAENVAMRFEELRQEMAGVLPDMDTYLRDTWAAQRPGYVLGSLVSKGLFTFAGPELYVNGVPQFGGEIAPGDMLTMINPIGSGTIYYTTDGADPQLADGTLNPAAQVYTNAVTLNRSVWLKTRVLSGGQWSALSEAIFKVPGEGPRITEFLASNNSGLTDEDREYSDWIEIHNPTNIPLDLDGWYLTDDAGDLNKWRIPEVVLQPGDYRVIFASGKDRADPAGELHTNFSLSAMGEYLALVMPDGETVAHEYAPQFPEQERDVSYGMGQSVVPLVSPDADLRYKVPSSGDATADWASPAFDDSAWNSSATGPTVLVTEAGTGTPDYVEVQNVSDQAIDTSGWYLVVNRATGAGANVNTFVYSNTCFPASLTPGEVAYWTDSINEHYVGFSDIPFGPSGRGWAMIMDSQGNVVDFAAWVYPAADIAALNITVDGHNVRGSSLWSGAGAEATLNPLVDTSVYRTGKLDRNDLNDFVFQPPQVGEPLALNRGLQNPDLVLPVTRSGDPGIGFSIQSFGFGGALMNDVQQAMLNVNASLWTRIAFDVTDPSQLDAMTLRMKYNDGFVAYLNGREIARSNAPSPLQWDSNATASRTVTESLQLQEFNVTAFLDALAPGTNTLAIQGLNVSASDGNFLIVPELLATSVQEIERYFAIPSPGSTNGDNFLGFVADMQFSREHDFYDIPFALTITSATPGTTIRYTTDGSLPTDTTGTVYSGAINISKTTTLRALAFKPGYRPTEVVTQTYIFLDDVLQQPLVPTGFPSTWNAEPADYQMDPDIVGSPLYSGRIKNDLKSIPTMSLVMNVADMFGSQGIYSNPLAEGIAWERPGSLEMFYPGNTTEGFQVNAGVRIYGGVGREPTFKKHSIRLLFKDAYGPTKLNYPLFGEGLSDSTDSIVLRHAFNDGYVWGGATSLYTRDEYFRRLQNALGATASHGTFVHLYINGLYWGLYNATERPDSSFAANYFGGEREQWDTLNSGEAVGDSNTVSWNTMLNLVRQGVTTEAQYQRLQGNYPDGTDDPAAEDYLDMENYINYLLTNFYTGNSDWPGHNWYAGRMRGPESTGFKFFPWDSEWCVGLNSDVNRDMTGASGSLCEPYSRLRTYSEFQVLFGDLAHKAFFNGGPFYVDPAHPSWDPTHPERNVPAAIFAAVNAEVESAMVAESARWGDVKSGSPYNLAQWQAQRSSILASYMPARSSVVLGQLKAAGLYPNVVAPSFQVNGAYQHGGVLDQGDQLSMTAPAGTIYYTLDGSDPRLVGGAISPTAVAFNPASPVILGSAALVKSRVRSGTSWSALNEAEFYVCQPASAANLAITELNYNPAAPSPDEAALNPTLDNDDFEFVELRNIGTEIIDLTGIQTTTGITLVVGTGTNFLSPGESAVVARDPVAFALRYGSQIEVAGDYSGSLNNDGERITLLDRFGGTIVEFEYSDRGDWPGRADGTGSSIELIDPAALPAGQTQRTAFMENGDNWRSSTEYGGSPGTQGIGPMAAEVVINEVLSNTDPPQLDAIELHNTTTHDIDLGGWFLSDASGNLWKYCIPDHPFIEAGGYLTLDERDFNPSGGVDPVNNPNDFALSSAGDEVWLMEGDGAGKLKYFVDHVEFGAAAVGESFGRWPDGRGGLYPMTRNTLGDPNSGPRFGPVIISEVHYNPDPAHAGDSEFVEVYNGGSSTVDLTGWQIGDGINYSFAAGTMLPARAALVVLPFDPALPANAARKAAFLAEHGIDDSVRLAGPFTGQLDNGGEKIQLLRPDVLQPGLHLLEDEVIYDDVLPWPVTADGGGDSLQRQGAAQWGNYAASWSAAAPSPGATDITGPAQVVGQYVFYDNSAFDNFDGLPGVSDDPAIATDKLALRPGQTATAANYTSYSLGINGLMVDLLDPANAGELGVDDFRFKAGSNNDPAGWADAPPPSSLVVRPGQGTDGSCRLTLFWNDHAIENQWLQVTVLVTANTGLTQPYVFYFGNAVGEAGNQPGNAIVNATDEILARNFPHGLLDPAAIDDPYDYNRDGLVNGTDQIIARSHQTNPLSMLRLLAAPASEPPKAVAAVQEMDGSNLSASEMAWLYEFAQSNAKSTAAKKSGAAESAVDWLLATDWQ